MFRKEILKEDCVVKCESEYQIKNLFKWLSVKGYRWQSGDELLKWTPRIRKENYITIYSDKDVCFDTIRYCGKAQQYNYNDIIKKPKDTTIDFMLNYLPDVKKIIYKDPDTIIVFKNNSVSMVERQQEHDLEKAILYAWVKKHKKKSGYGGRSFTPFDFMELIMRDVTI